MNAAVVRAISSAVARDRRVTVARAEHAAAAARRPGWRERALAPPPTVIVGAVVVFAVDQLVYQRVGAAVLPQAPLDWTDHLMTTLFIVWALRPLVGRSALVAALVASVVIDVDHIPAQLGSDVLTAGTARPYTHSLTTIVVLLAICLVWRRGRWPALGAAVGVASHLWRDLAEPQGSGIALLWPVSDATITTPAAVYLTSIAVLAAIALARSVARRRGESFRG